jgi:molecular chaperone HtpG
MSKPINEQNFKVDLNGIIELLSEHIYSTPSIFIRELLQNATDAIIAQKLLNEQFQGDIHVRLEGGNLPKLYFTDNGIGLTEQQIHDFLSIIGESFKRKSDYSNSFIGKFGIGLLSCFMVSSKIELITRTHSSNTGYRWIALANGTYTIEALNENINVGTTVILHPKPESIYYFSNSSIENGLRKYGEILPYPIQYTFDSSSSLINDLEPIWRNPQASIKDKLEFGRKTFHKNFISCFQLKIPEIGLDGLCYIQDKKSQIQQKSQSKIFVKNMLLSEKNEGLLPDWAFFIQSILNINDLSPTASRESFVIDSFYKSAKDIISNEIKQQLNQLAQNDSATFSTIINAHIQSIKLLAIEDDVILDLFMHHLVFETNKGSKSLNWIKDKSAIIYYTTSNDDYRQIKRIANAQEIVVINACYSYEAEILVKISTKYPNFSIKLINPFDLLNQIEINEIELQNSSYQLFLETANNIVQSHLCEAKLGRFNPTDLPIIFIADEKSANQHKYHNQIITSNNPFNNVLKNINNEQKKPILCFNLNNELIRNMIQSTDEKSTEAIIRLLYIQSLFLAQYPVQRKEMELMNYSLTQLLKK